IRVPNAESSIRAAEPWTSSAGDPMWLTSSTRTRTASQWRRRRSTMSIWRTTRPAPSGRAGARRSQGRKQGLLAPGPTMTRQRRLTTSIPVPSKSLRMICRRRRRPSPKSRPRRLSSAKES
ncbi:hypothetical protein EC988_010447, partial [Linderina pennispora]